jgi:Domain of unknown function (DUF4388)
MSLKGNLLDMSLVDLIQIFEATEKSGVILLRSSPLRGVIFSRDGRLIDAAIVDGLTHDVVATGEDAVIQLLQWDEAAFVFRPDSSVAQRPVRILRHNDWLVLEGMRRRSNPLAALPHQPITPDTRLAVLALPSDTASSMLLNLNQWRVLSEIGYSRNPRELCESLAMGFADAARIIAELVAIGLVEAIQMPAPAFKPAPKPAVPYRAQQIKLDDFDVIPKSAITAAPAPGRKLLDVMFHRIHDL